MAFIGRSVRQVCFGDFQCEISSGIDMYDDECWRAFGTDPWGDVVEVADGATRQDAEDNVVDLMRSRYSEY